jgi:hypothetical protein
MSAWVEFVLADETGGKGKLVTWPLDVSTVRYLGVR